MKLNRLRMSAVNYVESEGRDIGKTKRDLFGPNSSDIMRDSDRRQGRRDTWSLSGSRSVQIPVWAKKPHNL